MPTRFRSIRRTLMVVPVGGLLCLSTPPGFVENTGLECGLEAYAQGEYDTALMVMKPLAEQGDADTRVTLGVMDADGLGVATDPAEASRCVRLAAEHGPPARHEPAVRHRPSGPLREAARHRIPTRSPITRPS